VLTDTIDSVSTKYLAAAVLANATDTLKGGLTALTGLDRDATTIRECGTPECGDPNANAPGTTAMAITATKPHTPTRDRITATTRNTFIRNHPANGCRSTAAALTQH
jgi:hypothetical protein